MKQLLFSLMLLIGSLSVAAQCPDTVDCNSTSIMMTFDSLPNNGNVDSIEVNVQGKGPTMLYVDSIVGNTIYLSKSGLQCTDIVVVTDYYNSGKVASKCTESYVLPVDLVKFEATTIGDVILLEWATASELNNAGFDIERSEDGINWETIARIKGYGNSTSYKEYSFLTEYHKTVYFRLQQLDYDGNFEYSHIIVARVDELIPISIRYTTLNGVEVTKDHPDALKIIQYSNGIILKTKVMP